MDGVWIEGRIAFWFLKAIFKQFSLIFFVNNGQWCCVWFLRFFSEDMNRIFRSIHFHDISIWKYFRNNSYFYTAFRLFLFLSFEYKSGHHRALLHSASYRLECFAAREYRWFNKISWHETIIKIRDGLNICFYMNILGYYRQIATSHFD